METVTLREHPEITRVVRAADPGYRKHKAFFKVAERLTLHGTYWSGGSRSTYHAVRLTDGFSLGAPQYNPPGFGGPAKPPSVEVPVGVAIVETGFFCGKVATASVTINPADAARLLTVEVPRAR